MGCEQEFTLPIAAASDVAANTAAISALQSGQTAQDAEIARARGVSWTWANAAARAAQSVSASDLHAIGYQTDIGLHYRLVGTSPTRWGQLVDQSGWLFRSCYANPSTTSQGTSNGLLFSPQAGTPAARAISSTNKSTQLGRLAFATSGVAGNIGMFRTSTGQGFLTAGGFRARMVGVPGAVSASMRWCTGMSSGTFSANVDPNTLVSGVAIGCSGAADTSLQLYHNDAAGTATKINLASTHGVTFPACTVDDGYALELYSFDGSTITYQVTRLNTGVYVSGTLSTDLPATTAVMLMLYYGSNNADAAVVSLDFAAAEWSQRLV